MRGGQVALRSVPSFPELIEPPFAQDNSTILQLPHASRCVLRALAHSDIARRRFRMRQFRMDACGHVSVALNRLIALHVCLLPIQCSSAAHLQPRHRVPIGIDQGSR